MSILYQTLAASGVVVFILCWAADFEMTWLSGVGIRNLYYFNFRDFYFVGFSVMPMILSHIVTIWGHYYRADSSFQHSITKCTHASLKERSKISIWEKHDPWLGYTLKYWALILLSIILNVIWFVQPVVAYMPGGTERMGYWKALSAYVAFSSGYAAMGCCGMLLLLVLRRSMLHAFGFTYADLLPLHRWMGVAFVFWSTIHTIGYLIYYYLQGALMEEFNFDGRTRGPQNLIALVAYAALCGLGITAIPQVRRQCFVLFLTIHRIFTVVTFIGTLMHYPYYMIWYYVLPSVCLYLADRFIPKMIQNAAIAPKMICSFNKEADIVTVVLVSRNRSEPLKPYYPGDYVNLQIPALSKAPFCPIYHPFTIASYWAEDPYSITVYIRTFQENKTSWTHALAQLCEGREDPIQVETNVDGIFGDRNHDYLSAEVMVIFAAGAAITTFMSLLKAIAAQIDTAEYSAGATSTIRVHLMGTFRYESELYAYGDFMHRITNDPRFTSWLTVDLYVSRPDKTLSASENVKVVPPMRESVLSKEVEESQSLLGSAQRTAQDYGTTKARIPALAAAESYTSCSSSITFGSDAPTATTARSYKTLPTFPDASSASASTVHAKKDLALTTLILFLPMLAYVASRAVPWEGTWKGKERWCRTTFEFDQHMTERCMWSYSILPGLIHILVACVVGYVGLWVSRRSNLLCSESTSKSVSDLESTVRDLGPSMVYGEIDKSIPFKRGRMNVQHHIQELKSAGIGHERDERGAKAGKKGAVIVFGGGPDSFVDMVEDHCKRAKWQVEFHRETWSP